MEISKSERILHTKVTVLLNKALDKINPDFLCSRFLYLDYTSDISSYGTADYVYMADTINIMPYDCRSRAYSNEPAKIFYLHMYGNRRKTVTWLIENFNLTYLEKDYRKQYVLFKCDDVEMLYTLLKLRG